MGAEGANAPPIFFLHKNIFWLVSERRSNKKKTAIFSKRLFGCCRDKNKNSCVLLAQNRGMLNFASPPPTLVAKLHLCPVQFIKQNSEQLHSQGHLICNSAASMRENNYIQPDVSTT